MASSLIQPEASSLINAISGKGVLRARKGQEFGFLPLIVFSLMIKAMSGKGAARVGIGYNNMNNRDKIFSSAQFFSPKLRFLNISIMNLD